MVAFFIGISICQLDLSCIPEKKKKKKKKQCRSGRRPERTHNAEHQGEGERGKDRERGEKDNLDFAVY